MRQSNETLRHALCRQGLPPLAARVLAAREITGYDDIVPRLSTLPSPDFLPDGEKLCDLLAAAIARRQKICVVGDYDADGISATVLAVACLRRLGAVVTWRIPDRQRHGYGLHEEIVREAAAANTAVLLTVDNGISAHAPVALGKTLGLSVCITDHHLPPPALPAADCIVNPRLPPTPNIGENLAGVGVIFYAMAMLRKRLRAAIKMEDYLDLVALGSIADCVPLDALNRSLVGGGLMRLRGGGRPGLNAMAALKKLNMAAITCRDLSHFFAPHINAAGRFNQAALAVECLLADNVKTAREAAEKLTVLNSRRQTIVTEIMAATEAMNPQPPAVVLHHKEWPSGVVGIIAGRLSDLHNCPALVFAYCNGAWRGSGRAPAGWDLHRLVEQAATQCGEVLRFGGHRRAVGVTVKEIAPFARAFDECCRRSPIGDSPRWFVDEMPPPEELTTEAVAYLDRLVWGEAFARPLFAGFFTVSNKKPVGAGHMRLQLNDGNLRLPAIAFNCPAVATQSEAVFSLGCDRYTGKVTALIEALWPAA